MRRFEKIIGTLARPKAATKLGAGDEKEKSSRTAKKFEVSSTVGTEKTHPGDHEGTPNCAGLLSVVPVVNRFPPCLLW